MGNPYFMGSDIVFSNGLDALGIIERDSTCVLIESEFKIYMDLKT